MNEIKEGMYCYDKSNRKSGIGKIIGYEKNGNYYVSYKNTTKRINYGNLVASFYIKDLIDVGDIIYLEEFDDIDDAFFGRLFLIKNESDLENIIDEISDESYKILSIMTEEQFEFNSYYIEEHNILEEYKTKNKKKKESENI